MFSLKNVSKSYVTTSGRKYVFKSLTIDLPSDRNIGLIGKNGSGKSTLMRLLSGTDTPDSGIITSEKSVSWPVGLSGGFQGSLSAGENAKFVCRLHGMHGTAMRAKVDYVRSFAEIGKWFDEPVKTYSSGMRSRVAFGLSMAFDFDYYLIDEIMAVGDIHFRNKCEAVFKEKLVRSKIMIVTHSMSQVKKLCDVILLVNQGRIDVYEDIDAGIAAYNK